MPVAEHLEVERKYDAVPSAKAPDWTGLEVDSPMDSILRAVYFDTRDLRLLARGITLRWRSGEAAEGWHLKTPARAGRVELHVRSNGVDPDRAPDPARLPDEIALRIRAWTAGHALVPVARLVTLREETVVVGAGVFCDDIVTATRQADESTIVWREWEFELFDDTDSARVRRVDERILRAGARQAGSASKLARALDHVAPAPKRSRGPLTVGAFLAQRLGPMRDRLCARDFPVRTDEHDSVHQLRVTTRALRSLLQAFGPFLRKAPTKHLGRELRWLASELGTARDAEVRAERFGALGGSKGANELRSGAAETLAEEEREAYRTAHHDVLQALDSRRYFRLLDALDAYVADPPVRRSDRRTAASAALAEAVEGAAGRLFAADEAVAKATGPQEREEALHDVRKRAKGLRYVGDLAKEAGAGPFEWAKPVKQLQELLGEHQDAVVLREWLRERARHGGGETFLRGVEQLIAGESARARKGEGDYAKAIHAVREAWGADTISE